MQLLGQLNLEGRHIDDYIGARTERQERPTGGNQVAEPSRVWSVEKRSSSVEDSHSPRAPCSEDTNSSCSGDCSSRSQALEERHRFRERLNPLHGPVRHVGRRLAASGDRGRIRALRHQVADELVVAPGGRVVERAVAVVVPRVHVGSELFHEELHRREPSVGDVPVGVSRKALAVPDARSGVDGIDRRSPEGNLRESGMILAITTNALVISTCEDESGRLGRRANPRTSAGVRD